ncbi:MAG: PIG-L deacetylase family protein [Limisphaerales bacterium]
MSAKKKTTTRSRPPCAIAIVAHPDDIEFQIAGTLLMLKEAGWDTHYWNVSSGNCGSLEMNPRKTAKVRREEAKNAAKILGATWHPPIAHDLEITYDTKTLRKVASVIRMVRPSIVLTHSPHDYMEDHMNVCRLAVTGAFAHGMPNFKVTPDRPPYFDEVTVYHCMPHGLMDGLRKRVIPGQFVNTSKTHEKKLQSLAAHKSQQNWLGSSQQMNSYLQTCDDMSRELGKQSKRFKHAEGFRRHSHLGFCSESADPLKKALGKNCLTNKTYEKILKQGG